MLAHLTDAAQPFDPAGSQRRLRIAMSDVGEIHFMPGLMDACARHAPGVRIDSVRLSGADL
ncbi:putative hth-type (Hthlysr) transcriptional activator [Bordetella holmesii 70147]|nr:putative hth-type (Hthlysr) transcriptional activator [Bordetella holmesii 70147]